MDQGLQADRPDGDAPSASGGSAATDLMLEARMLFHRKQFKQAADVAQRAISCSPDDPDLWNTRGVFLRAGGRSTEAIWDYRQAIALQPSNAGTWSNLGNALADVKQLDTAIACHQHAIDLQPENVEFYRNLARAFLVSKRHREALEPLNKALRLAPANAGARFDRSMAYLNLGEYKRGWSDYEIRLQALSRPMPGRRWRGQPYRDGTLVIVSEQGSGDAIWAARYFRKAKALGGQLIVECHKGLVPLFSAMPEVDRVIALGEGLPSADFHCHTCSLAGLFTNDFDAIPSEPYISVPAERLKKFNAPLKRAGGALRVGIVWSGNQAFVRNPDRAAPLSAFLQAFAYPGVQLYSLQKGPLEKDLVGLPEDTPLINLAPFIEDFADSAAILSELDLIIMTDTAIAHLCGALGKPVWVLLSYESFWLWLYDRHDSPWYPSMRFFRQKAWGDWGGVFDKASAALLQMCLARARK